MNCDRLDHFGFNFHGVDKCGVGFGRCAADDAKLFSLDGALHGCRRDRSRALSGVLVKLIDKKDDLTFSFGGFREDSLHAGGELTIGLRTLCQGIKTQAKDAFPAQSVRHVAESDIYRYATSDSVTIEI